MRSTPGRDDSKRLWERNASATRAQRPLPAWFRPEQYAFTPNLNILGWWRMLLERSRARADDWYAKFLGYEPYYTRENIDRFWEDHFLKAALPSRKANAPLDDWELDRLRDHEALRVIEIPKFPIQDEDALVDFLKEFGGQMALFLNPNAPQAVLEWDFKRWIARQGWTFPVKRPRKKRAPSSEQFIPKDLETWAEYRVLAVHDLDFYCERRQGRLVSSEQLADAFDIALSDRKAWGTRARNAARQALASEAALATQIEARIQARRIQARKGEPNRRQ